MKMENHKIKIECNKFCKINALDALKKIRENFLIDKKDGKRSKV